MSGFKFLTILSSPSRELLRILNENVIGTPGLGMLYQHLGVENKIHKIAKPYFITLGRGNSIFGTGCLCKRNTQHVGTTVTAFYIRYFTFKSAFRKKKISERHSTGNSVVRSEVHSLLKGQGLDINANEVFFHYAYVDPRNLRSVVLCNEFGFQKVREYTSVIFSRLNPAEKNIEEIPEHQKETVLSLLKEFYKNYTMFSTENLFNGRSYYVIRNDVGEIVAGASANPDRWNVIDLPGKAGKLTLNIFSNLPFLNRIINRNYRFLTLDGVYYLPGFEEKLADLLEGLLYKHSLYSALTITDADSVLYSVLKSLDLGSVAKLSKEVRGNVIVKCQDVPSDIVDDLSRYPAYISGIDVT